MRIIRSVSDPKLFTTPSPLGCEVFCEEIYREVELKCGNELLYVTAFLSVLTLFLCISSALFYSLYKRERKMRMTPWQLNSEDIKLDKTHQTATDDTPKLADNWVQQPDEKLQLMPKRAKHYFTTTGEYKGMLVAVQKFKARWTSTEKKNFLSDLDPIFSINHDHVCKFYGANQADGDVIILTEYCTRGSLQDLLDEHSHWDDVFKNSLIFDIVKGMLYLHQSVIGSHGNLKPSNCLIDSRFMVKITDFGCIGQRHKVKATPTSGLNDRLWTAPELLKATNPLLEGTKQGDVYSFAIIAQEILYQRGFFYRKKDNHPREEILKKLIDYTDKTKEPFRPTLKDDDDIIINEAWRSILKKCWAENPKQRPDFSKIFQIAQSQQTENTLIDSLLQRLQKYSDFLEEKVEEKTEQYKAEKERSDSLLYQMLPRSVANRLKRNTDVMPESYEQVTVYFSDIVGFSAICHQSQPLEVVQMLNDLYTMFDQIIDGFDVYKVETIGDAYMVVSGLPIRNGDNHAREIARMAIRLRDSVSNEFQIRHLPNTQMKLRAGIHTGPVVAGVVGLKMPRYCLFGDTVNTAARMEQNGEELKIHISPHTKEILDKFGTFRVNKRRKSVTLKGLGEWSTWWLADENKFGNSESSSEVFASSENSSPSGQDKQRRVRSYSQDVGRSKLFARLAEETPNGKVKRHSNAHPLPRKPSNYSVAPARYRPSSIANLSKQRRHGSAIIPFFTRNDSMTLDNEILKQNSSRRKVSIVTPRL